MADNELQNQLMNLLESSPSYLSLDAMKKAEMKMKLSNMPEKQMYQAVEVFLQEKKEMAAAENEITNASSTVKQMGKRLHTMMLKNQTEEEQEASSRSSEEILKQLPTSARKKGCFGMLILLTLPIGTLWISQFFGIHIF